jgi:hypothetical protein
MLAIDVTGARVQEIGWVEDHLADLEADFRVHYGMSGEQMLALPGPEFYRLAARTVAYRGVMQARAQALIDAEQHQQQDAPPVREPYTGQAQQRPDGVVETRTAAGDVVREIPPNPEAISKSALGSLIDMG